MDYSRKAGSWETAQHRLALRSDELEFDLGRTVMNGRPAAMSAYLRKRFQPKLRLKATSFHPQVHPLNSSLSAFGNKYTDVLLLPLQR